MTDRKNKTPQGTVDDITEGLTGLLGGVGDALSEMLKRLEEEGNGEFKREGVFNSDRGPIRAETGIRVSLAGKSFSAGTGTGPRKKAPEPVRPEKAESAPAAAEPRPVTIDSFWDGSEWTATADLPGATEADLEVSLEDGKLMVRTTGKRAYLGSTTVPENADYAQKSASLQNGIFEIVLPAKEPASE